MTVFLTVYIAHSFYMFSLSVFVL